MVTDLFRNYDDSDNSILDANRVTEIILDVIITRHHINYQMNQ
jgi:hypothetical protein